MSQPSITTEPFVVATQDGWDLALHRVSGRSGPVPVLLLPGYGTDHRCFVPPEAPGVAHALRAAGRDCWMLDFRGSGASRPRTGDAGPVSLDAKVAHDLPAAIEAVCEFTESQRVDVVGHSMGGVILYVHLALRPDARVRRAATLASPASFRPEGCGGVRELALSLAGRFARRVPRLPVRGLFAVVTRIPLEQPYRTYFDRSNAPSRHMRRYVREMATDMYGDELAQLAAWFGTGRLTDQHGRGDHRLHLKRVHTPILFIAGAADRVVARAGIELAHATLGAREKQLLLVGRETGARADYGHLDLLAGRYSAVDVFPPLVRWLEVTP